MNYNSSTILQAHQISWCTVDPKATSLAMQETKSKVSWKNLAMWDWCEVIIRIVCVHLINYLLSICFCGKLLTCTSYMIVLYCSNNYVCIDISQVFWFDGFAQLQKLRKVTNWLLKNGTRKQKLVGMTSDPLSLDAMSLLGRTQWWCTAHLHLWRICLNGMTCTNHVYAYRTETKNVEHNIFPHFWNLKDFHCCLNLKCNHSIPNLEGRKIVDLLSFEA